MAQAVVCRINGVNDLPYTKLFPALVKSGF